MKDIGRALEALKDVEGATALAGNRWGPGYPWGEPIRAEYGEEIDIIREVLIKLSTPNCDVKRVIDEFGEWLCCDLEKELAHNNMLDNRPMSTTALNQLSNLRIIAEKIQFYRDNVVKSQPPQVPIPTSLRCPECGEWHVDEGEWETRLHKTHQCQSCGCEWRPYEYPTVGVLPFEPEYVLVPRVATRDIEDAIGRSRNLKASEIWEDAVHAAGNIRN